MRTLKPTDVPKTAGLPAEDRPGMAAAAGVAEVNTGGGPGLVVPSGQALSPSAMAAALGHAEAVRARALAVLVAPGSHDEHVRALLELRAAVAGLQDLAGAGQLLPAGRSVPIRNLAVTDDQSLFAAAAAALAHSEETP